MKKIIIASIISVVTGIFLGFLDYQLSSSYLYVNAHDNFIYIVMIVSILIPLIIPFSVSFLRKKTLNENFWLIMKYFIISAIFTILSLILAAVISTILYCTYGACSEFAGLEIMLAFIWAPVPVIVDAFIIFIAKILSIFFSKKSAKNL